MRIEKSNYKPAKEHTVSTIGEIIKLHKNQLRTTDYFFH